MKRYNICYYQEIIINIIPPRKSVAGTIEAVPLKRLAWNSELFFNWKSEDIYGGQNFTFC